MTDGDDKNLADDAKSHEGKNIMNKVVEIPGTPIGFINSWPCNQWSHLLKFRLRIPKKLLYVAQAHNLVTIKVPEIVSFEKKYF